MFATAESLARRGAWDIEQIRWMDLQQGTYGLDGRLYSRKGIGQPLLALPLTWLGLVTPGLGAATTTLLFGGIVTALTGVLLARYLMALGHTEKTGFIAALIFGVGTLAWPYAKTSFSEPLTGLLLLLSAYTLLRYCQTGRIRYTIAAGAAISWAVATRYAEGIMLPLFGLLLLAYAYPLLKQISLKSAQAQRFLQPLGSLRSLLPPLIGFAAPMAIVGFGLLAFNLRRYGDPFNTGYLPQESFSAIWWQGVLGQLVSPGRGLLFYSPILIYTFFGVRWFIRRHRVEGWLALAVILGHLLLYGKWFMWHGGFAWGPRFMVPTLPFWVILMAPVIERIFPGLAAEPPVSRATANYRTAQFLFLLILAISIVVQIPGVAVDFELWQNRLLETSLPLFAPITFFAARYSPLLGTWQYLRLENLDFAWTMNGQLDGLLLTSLVALVLVQGWTLTARPLRPLLSVGLTLIVTGFLLIRAHANQPADLAAALARVNAAGVPDEALIYNDPELAVPLAELYRGRGLVLGLALGGPPLPPNVTQRLDQITHSQRQVWWLPNWLPPAESSVEQYLLATGFKVEERTFNQQRLLRFAYPGELPGQNVPQTALGAATVHGSDELSGTGSDRDGTPRPGAFGEITLAGAAFAADASAGQPFLIELHWRTGTPLKADLRVFTQLLDANGQRLAGSDGQPANWTRPTTSWRPGETVIDRHAIPVPPEAPPGRYTLVTGLYDPATGRRLLTSAGQDFVEMGAISLQ